MHRPFPLNRFGILVQAILFLGCGADPLGRQPVSGMVTLDGSPVENGTVSFHPVDNTATASAGAIEKGQFALDRERGLAAGKYRVTINAPKPGTGQAAQENALPGDPLPVPEELIPAEWNTNSNEVVEVNGSAANEFNFAIKSKAK
jgi:hypothetical protein